MGMIISYKLKGAFTERLTVLALLFSSMLIFSYIIYTFLSVVYFAQWSVARLLIIASVVAAFFISSRPMPLRLDSATKMRIAASLLISAMLTVLI